MSKIDAYGIFQNNLFQNKVNQKKDSNKAQKSDRTDQSAKTKQKQPVQLSLRAQQLLDELRNKYRNMDFMVADYETDEEAQSYLSRGTKEFSVLIDPETLEEMAANEEVKEKYLGIIEDATAKFKDMEDQLGDKKDDVVRMGMTIDKDGTVKYFAELSKMNEAQRERIEQAKERKQEEQKKASGEDKRARGKEDDRFIKEGMRSVRVQSDSLEGLLEAIKNVDWSQVKGDNSGSNGGLFDLSI